MSFAGFICEVSGEPISPDECLSCARGGAPGCNMTAPVIKGILDGLRPDDFGLTVTTLLSCPRKNRLKRSEPYWLKPSECWWAYRGQLMHGVAESYAKNDIGTIAETRFSTIVNVKGKSLPISGKPDLVFLNLKHVIDYKTTKSVPRPWKTYACPETGVVLFEGQWAPRKKTLKCEGCGESHDKRSIEKVGAPRPYRRHIQQVSLYRLLLYDNGISIDTAEIVYQDMNSNLRVQLKLHELEETRRLLENRAALHLQSDLPGVLTSDVWECDWCEVREACERLNGAPVGKA